MGRVVVISKTAERKLDALFNYLENNWSVKVKINFIQKLDKNISLIKTQPESFPVSLKAKGLHKCVITKQTTLFYRFDDEKIKIVTIFDSRQNPKSFNEK